MTSVDKAAIMWSIGIVAAFMGIAFAAQGMQESGQSFTAPVSSEPMEIEEETPRADPFADEAAQVKASSGEKEVMIEETVTIEEESTTPEEPAVTVTAPTIEPVPEMTGPQTVTVSLPAGTAVPGCEETDACYVPSSVSINVGDTVSWSNDDTAAHTVTSGSPTGGPDGIFDSSLFMAGTTYEHTFNDAGSYDYFCMVHPWMKGSVQVS